MPNEADALRQQFLLLMATDPIRDYSADPAIYGHIGKFIADQADERANVRRRETR